MRRRDPRALADALGPLRSRLAPRTTLARVQAVWEEVAGSALAAEAEPVAERAGTVTVACRSSVWAAELSLMAPDLAARLNAALSEAGERAPVAELRFVTQAST